MHGITKAFGAAAMAVALAGCGAATGDTAEPVADPRPDQTEVVAPDDTVPPACNHRQGGPSPC